MAERPDDHRSTAADWHGGQWTALYAYASTGTVLWGLDQEIRDCLDQVERGQLDTDWDPEVERSRLAALLEHVEADIAVLQAGDIGREHGAAAAEWWQQEAIGSRATGDTTATARRVIRGIEDGDPEVLDALPGPRGDYGQSELEDDCDWEEPTSGDHLAYARWAAVRPRVMEAYESAFHDVLVRTVAEACWHEVVNAEAQRLVDLRRPGSAALLPFADEAVGL
jgi:hypothetical protein